VKNSFLLFSLSLVAASAAGAVSSPDAYHTMANRSYCGNPSIAVSRGGGRLWATVYASVTGGRDKNGFVALYTSDNRGDNWREVLVYDPDRDGPDGAYDPVVSVTDDDRLHWVFSNRSGAWQEVVLPAAEIPKKPYPNPTEMNSVPSVRSLPCRLSSGALLDVRGGRAVVSYDGGKRWQGGLPLPFGEEPCLTPCCAEAPEGTIYIVWAGEPERLGDIHFARINEDQARLGRPDWEGNVLLKDFRTDGTVCKRFRGVPQNFSGTVDFASEKPAVVETPSYRVTGRRLVVDADVVGLKVSLLDGEWRPIAGFTEGESVPLSGKGRLVTAWKGNPDVSSAVGRDVTVHFAFEKGTIRSFVFED